LPNRNRYEGMGLVNALGFLRQERIRYINKTSSKIPLLIYSTAKVFSSLECKLLSPYIQTESIQLSLIHSLSGSSTKSTENLFVHQASSLQKPVFGAEGSNQRSMAPSEKTSASNSDCLLLKSTMLFCLDPAVNAFEITPASFIGCSFPVVGVVVG